MSEDDPLWNAQATPDAELAGLRATLAPYAVGARGIAEWKPQSAPAPRRRRIAWRLAAAVAAVALLVFGMHRHRLDWSDGASWAIEGAARASIAQTFGEGQRLSTDGDAGATIEVARIGRIELSPGSTLRLVETRAAHHRVDLEHGHLRARIWAPPGYFGLDDGRNQIIDLGCDFDVWKERDGSGRVRVRSGWIAWRGHAGERLVPAGHAVRIDGGRASTPLREAAAGGFRDAVDALDELLAADATDGGALDAAAGRVAATASDADRMTLLNLLLERPSLASGPLYVRAAAAFDMPVDPAQRRALAAGDRTAADAWWARLPTQPKHWWMNWRDVF